MRTMRSAFICLLAFTYPHLAGHKSLAQSAVPAVVAAASGEHNDPQHNDPQWADIERHLADPATATPAQLELQADVLRARRYPADALLYYNYALQRGGTQIRLFKKIGVTELELHNEILARLYFQRGLKLRRKDAELWNNLGAVEFVQHQYLSSINDYRRAVKFEKRNAVFHSNLGIAYFQQKDFDSGRKEMMTAVKLDPLVFQRSGNTGVSAQLLSPDDHGRFCYEMARAYARAQDETSMLQELSRASESGFDVLHAMGDDPVLSKYRSDPRVQMLVRVAKTMRAGRMAPANVAGAIPPLPSASTP